MLAVAYKLGNMMQQHHAVIYMEIYFTQGHLVSVQQLHCMHNVMNHGRGIIFQISWFV